MVYKWNGFNFPVKAEIVGKEFEKIEQEEGELIPDTIVARAEDEESVLHPLFEWDDQTAAKAYRVEQARHVICALVTVLPESEDNKTVRALVNVSVAREKGRFINIREAMESEKTKEVVMRAALAELISFKMKYARYKEFAKVCDAIDSVREDMDE